MEIIVSIAIFAVITTSLLSLILGGIRTVRENESRVVALGVATERMEVIKNLPYDSIGTVGGVPTGSIAQTENFERNNVNFTISTDIRYVDDNYDSTLPTDTLSTDYKQATITVDWVDPDTDEPVVLTTYIVPNGIETTASGGTLWIEVFDPTTEPITPVANATVSIQAPTLNPPIAITSKTDANGRYILPGAPVGVESYNVSVSKTGFNSTQTYERNVDTNPNPEPPYLNVLEDEITTEYFQISELVDSLSIHLEEKDTQLPVTANVTIHGEKTVGTDGEGSPIYKYYNSYTTDASGNIHLQNIEADTYHIIFDEEASDYVIAAQNLTSPVIALPNTQNDITFSLLPYEPFTLLLTVNNSTDLPIANATVRLYTTDLEVDITQTSDMYGQVFFADLFPQTYNVEISGTGYTTYTGTLVINGNENQIINLANNE